MTVSNLTSRVTYTGDAVTVAFPVTFPFYVAGDLVVISRVIATGVETTQTLTTHYSVTGGSGSTGTVTAVTAPATTVQWIIKRAVPLTQAIDYVANAAFSSSTHEEGLDRAAMRDQDLDERLDRALVAPQTDSASLDMTLPSSVDRKGKYLGFSSTTGAPVAVSGTTSTLVASTFIETLLDDPDAATARTTLGISAVNTGLQTGYVPLAETLPYLTLHNGMIVASIAANALTIAIKTLANADPSASSPVRFIINDETQATGTPDIGSITAANSLVISSGSTMGFASATAGRIWVVLFNDAGTYRLGAINCRTGTTQIKSLDEGLLESSTAEGGAGAADGTRTFYTGTAVTSKPYKILGFMTWNSGLTTAGTWDALPTVVHQFGPGSKKPGDLLQEVSLTSGATDTSTTVLPDDDSIPQNTEGEEWAAGTLAFTALSPTNIRDVYFEGFIGSTENRQGVALFIDTTADALAAGGCWSRVTSPSASPIKVAVRGICADVTAHTFKMRFGPGSAGTAAINGGGSGRIYGGVCYSALVAREIMA